MEWSNVEPMRSEVFLGNVLLSVEAWETCMGRRPKSLFLAVDRFELAGFTTWWRWTVQRTNDGEVGRGRIDAVEQGTGLEAAMKAAEMFAKIYFSTWEVAHASGD